VSEGEEKFSGAFWGIVVVGVTGLVVAVGFLAGFFLGHFTGHDKTTTVTALSAQAGGGETTASSASGIVAAPAFSADELAAEPTTNWITNGGSLSNARYSPLDEIDTGTVSGLKGKWHIHLDGSGIATKYSAEGTPIVYEGTMYIPTGADDVFAIDVKTGRKLWTYKAKLPEQISTVCCGWDNRGVAIGDGLVYVGRLDGKVVALDQQTGKVKWTAEVGRWQNGETITSAPLYYDGRIYAGVSGGEFGIRGRLTAFDAKTGKLDWKSWTIPGPGETGHNTWPAQGESWRHGGAPVWNTPAVDPELNMLYFSTGNAAPDLNGSGRPGDNLFTTSILAIDATTGEYKWHFQEVHHDSWDYDAPSPVVLWNAEVEGNEVKGLSQPGKTGWLYMLNRETGKPIHGIEEKAVPQNKAEQATAATQPYPDTPSFVPQTVNDEQFQEIKKLAAEAFKGKDVKVRKGKIFDPFGHDATVVAPGPSGGTNWPPSSYNPNTEDVYICGVGGYASYQTEGLEKLNVGKTYLSSVLTLTGFGAYDGYLTAQNVSTGEIDWQKKFPGESCYSGTTTTAGNLVFSGRNNGDLVAYDAASGEQLWSFQTGAGANTTPAIFEEDGTEYVAFYAGGNSLAASSHGDDLWLFSLDGEIEPVKAGGEAEQGEHAGEESPGGEVEESEGSPAEAEGGKEEAAAPDAAAGKAVFSANCSICHGFSGEGGNGGPDLTTQPLAQTTSGAIKQVTNGGCGMPPVKGVLTGKEIEDVAAYVAETINGK
jgi:PQQ-dependent dehydrogenase (methanol/ethanol family)